MIICAIGSTEIILIAAVVLLIFGGKKIPELMKGLGQGVRQFKKGMQDSIEDENTPELSSNINKEKILQERLKMKKRQLEQEGLQPIEHDYDHHGLNSANPNSNFQKPQ